MGGWVVDSDLPNCVLQTIVQLSFFWCYSYCPPQTCLSSGYTCHMVGNFISRQCFDGLSNFRCNFSKSWIFPNCPEIRLPKFAHFWPAVWLAVSNLDDTPQITKLSPDHVTIFMISTRLPLFEFEYQTLYSLIQNIFLNYILNAIFNIYSKHSVFKTLKRKRWVRRWWET